MVKIGDKIETDTGLKGEVVHITSLKDRRFVILFKDNETPYYLIEGDNSFIVKE